MDFNFQQLSDLDFKSLSLRYSDSFFNTPFWFDFLKMDVPFLTPIHIAVYKGDKIIGVFNGGVEKRFGITIMGSPFRGWSTCYMGFSLDKSYDPLLILPALKSFLIKTLKCDYIEIVDCKIPLNRAILNGYNAYPVGTLLLDIDKSDDELFKVFKVDCRNYIRQFEKRGAVLRIVDPTPEFAFNFYAQLVDVFAKQSLRPTYQLKKVTNLIKTIPNENLLCLEVLLPDSSKCIATSIFFGYEDVCFFWGGASYREYQHFRPNEYMIWTAIKYWREKGCVQLDMIGIRDYKKKFGSIESSYTRIVFSKYPFLIFFRNFAEKLYFVLLNIKFKLHI